MNVIKQEVTQHVKSLIIWSLSLGLFVLIFSAEFSAYNNNPELLDFLDAFPSDLMEAFGIAGANLTTLNGFMSVVLVYINLIGSVFAIMLGSTLINKEHKVRTAEFLYVMPVKRMKVLASKMVAAVLLNLMLILIVYGMMVVSVLGYDPNQEFFTFMGLNIIVMVVLLLFWSALGMLLGCVLAKPRQATIIGVIFVFIAYILSVFIPLVGSIDYLKVLTPFAYFNAQDILATLSIPAVPLISIGVLGVVFVIVSLAVYHKKDLLY